MRIGIIGAGQVGTTLGRAWANVGHDVVYGVRDAGKAAPHERARMDTVRGAAQAADVALLVVPWAAAEGALAEAGDFGGKPLVDVTNPIGPGFALTLGHTTSGAERVASIARNACVVKAFNTTGHENMANPRYGERRVVMPIAGDDVEAVQTVAKLAAELGFESVALKGLAHARELEPFGMLWIKLALAWGHGRSIGFGIGRRSGSDRVPERRTAQPRVISIVGGGNIGGALARAWLRAGHDVRIAARDPGSDEVRALVTLGAKATTVADGAKGAEVVVFAIPAGAALEVGRSMEGLDRAIVVDCTNALAKGLALQFGHTTSSAEELARALPNSRLVRAFHQQGAEVLENPIFGGLPATNFVAGDDAEARAVVAALSSDVGLDTIDVGPLASARLLEPITPLWISMAQSLGTRELGLSLMRR